MKFIVSSAAVAAFAVNAAAQTVSGTADGFAAGVTGGGVSIPRPQENVAISS